MVQLKNKRFAIPTGEKAAFVADMGNKLLLENSAFQESIALDFSWNKQLIGGGWSTSTCPKMADVELSLFNVLSYRTSLNTQFGSYFFIRGRGCNCLGEFSLVKVVILPIDPKSAFGTLGTLT